MDPTYRALRGDEVEHVKWALHTAVSWSPERELPPYEVVIDHPKLALYHRNWGRPGDVGVAAERDGEVLGVALFRLFTEEDHGHGFVDEETPELAIAVADRDRGNGIGTRLLDEIATAARAQGFSSLSLSVDVENPALRLYERAGYRELSRDEGGVLMVLDL